MGDQLLKCSINMKLRERYLETLLKLNNHQCFLKCHERTNLLAQFQTISPSSDYIILSKIKTPSGYIDQCAVRQSDILEMTIQNNI